MAFIFYVTYQAEKYRPIDTNRPENGIFHRYERDVLDAFESGRRLPESVKQKFPERVFLERKFKQIGDVFNAFGCVLGCGEKLKALMEEMEPGLHEFFPLPLVTADGEPLDQRYYLVNICSKFDALLVNHSCVKWYSNPKHPEYGERLITSVPEGHRGEIQYALSIQRIKGHHVWQGDKLLKEWYCSDEFRKRCSKAKLRGFTYETVAELDIPWDEVENYGDPGPDERGARPVRGSGQ